MADDHALGRVRCSVVGIDPGPLESGLVMIEYEARNPLQQIPRILTHETVSNEELIARLPQIDHHQTMLVLESIQSYGKPTGQEILQTVLWSGRIIQAWLHGTPVRSFAQPGQPDWTLLSRPTIKSLLCHAANAKDAHVRQALINCFGPSRLAAIGTKKAPGPLYGVTGHAWSALAVAVAWLIDTGHWQPF